MTDDYRRRCADAAMKAWGEQAAMMCDHSQIIPIGAVVDAMLDIRDAEMEQLKDDALGVVAEAAQERSAARERARTAEAANARVRQLHAETPHRPGFCCCANPYPCPTIRALDGEEPDHG